MADDNDDLVNDVMGKLKRALGEIDGDGLRDVVREGLREAMRAIEDPAVADVEDFGSDDDDEPANNVVQLTPQIDANETGTGVSVRVLRGGLDDGTIRVEDSWQTVYAGTNAAPYRIRLSRGKLEVSVDDQVMANLVTGQTTDVEGRAIRVRGTGHGGYRRLT